MTKGAGKQTSLFRYHPPLPELGTPVQEKPVPETGFRNQDTVNSRFASFWYYLRPFLMKLGYARVSTSEQVLDLQLDALRQTGCEQVFTDTVSGVQPHKPSWEHLLAYARPGDTVVIW